MALISVNTCTDTVKAVLCCQNCLYNSFHALSACVTCSAIAVTAKMSQNVVCY